MCNKNASQIGAYFIAMCKKNASLYLAAYLISF
jgi:hypothetical protein